MKITYEQQYDVMYIRLVEGDCQCRTMRLNDQIALDIGPDEQLVGIEVLDASEVLGTGKVPVVGLENVQSMRIAG